jgi:MarR family transcriptional regulator, lower aerobic nicotinate degradation pathway regulator
MSSAPDSADLVPGPVPLPEELLARSGFLLVRLGLQFKARALDQLNRAGFNQYHYSVLALLDEQPRETQAAIADTLGLDRSQLVRILDPLEDRELIARHRDRSDRRRHTVSVTASGRRQLRRLRDIIDSLEDELLAPLDPPDRDTLHTLLLQLASAHDARCAGEPAPD